jgi:hypothetical protein
MRGRGGYRREVPILKGAWIEGYRARRERIGIMIACAVESESKKMLDPVS